MMYQGLLSQWIISQSLHLPTNIALHTPKLVLKLGHCKSYLQNLSFASTATRSFNTANETSSIETIDIGMVDDEQPIELNDLPDKGSVQENGQYMSAILLVGIQDWYNKINFNVNWVEVM